jgi:hypothetical protein
MQPGAICPASPSRGGLSGLAGVPPGIRPARCPRGGVPPAVERQLHLLTRRTSQLLRHVLNEKQRAVRAVTRRTEATVRVCAGAVWGGASSRLYVAPQAAPEHPHRMQPSFRVPPSRSDGCGRGPRAWGRADGRRAALSTNPLRYRARGQRQKTVTAGGWAELPGELVEKVLEAVAGCWARREPQAGWRLGVLPGVNGGAASLLGGRRCTMR